MAKVDPNDFLLNTDYELDKIILVKTGNFTSSASIKHELKFTPLIFGVWSTNQDFTMTNTLGSVISSEPIPGVYTPPLSVGCRAGEDRILLYSNGDGSSSTPIYYRIYAFAPPKQNVSTPTTASFAHQFLLNTDYNYRKIKSQGEFTQSNKVFKHGLGYTPQVMAWIQYAEMSDLPEYSKMIAPITSASLYTDYRFIVTPSEIKLADNFPFSLIEKVIWRLYYDEA